MKIFLNDRIIEFLRVAPEPVQPVGLVTGYLGPEQLREAWLLFLRYEKYQHLVVTDPLFREDVPEESPSVTAFYNLFRLVQAAGGLVVNEKGEYLFIHRFGKWDLPKGKISRKDRFGQGTPADESAVARLAALREVQEETGIQELAITREILPTWHIYEEKNTWRLKQTRWFAMEAPAGQALQPQTEEGIFLVRWIPKKELFCVMDKTYASIRELLLETLF